MKNTTPTQHQPVTPNNSGTTYCRYQQQKCDKRMLNASESEASKIRKTFSPISS
jgi:hypothetical protein